MENERLTNEQVLLKTSLFGGFEKREVLSYIDQLREQNTQSIRELEQQMGDMSQARLGLEQQIASFEQTMAGLENQLSQKSVRINELTSELSSLRCDLDEKQQTLQQAERALGVQKEQNRILALKAQSFEYKAGRYDEMSVQIGDILIDAKQSAKDILRSANQKAQQIEQDAVVATREATERLTGLREDISTMRQSLEAMVNSFNHRLGEIDQIIDGIELTPSTVPAQPCPQEFFRAAAQTGE